MNGNFGGTQVDEFAATGAEPKHWVVEWPSSAQWNAGIANNNQAVYPLGPYDSEGACISFMAALEVHDGGAVGLIFKLENEPYPNNNPAVDSDPVAVNSGAWRQYSAQVDTSQVANQANQEYRSLILYIMTRNTPVKIYDVEVTPGTCPAPASDGSTASPSSSPDPSGSESASTEPAACYKDSPNDFCEYLSCTSLQQDQEYYCGGCTSEIQCNPCASDYPGYP